MFALIQWSDLFTSVIDLNNVCSPKKEVSQYEEGEYIEAKYQGKVYRAVISHINDDDRSNSVTSSTLEEDDNVSDAFKTQRELAMAILTQKSPRPTHFIHTGSENDDDSKRKSEKPNLQKVKPKEGVEKDEEVCQNEDDSEKKNEKSELQKVTPKEGVEKNQEVRQKEFVTRKEFERLKEKIKKMENKIEQLEKQSAQSADVTVKVAQSEKDKVEIQEAASKLDESNLTSYNGYTIDNLKDAISHFDRLYDAVNCILLKLFPKEYILTHSVSGKSGNSKIEPKSQFDKRLYSVMLSVVKSKFTNVTTKDITERVHSVQKCLKRVQAKQL